MKSFLPTTMTKRLLPFVAVVLLWATAALAQNNNCQQYLVYGAVLTPAQWQFCFSQKQDTYPFSGIPLSNALPAGQVFVGSAGNVAVPQSLTGDVQSITALGAVTLNNTATTRLHLGLAIGTNVEAWSSVLDAVAAAGAGTPTGFLNAQSGVYSFLSAPVQEANVAALRANTLPFAVVQLPGYSTAGDGGGGSFSYVATDTSSADNGCTIFVDADFHRYYRQYSGPLSALDCSGSDIGAKVNNAFASFATNQCGTVLLPVGNYNYSTTIQLPAALNAGQQCNVVGLGQGPKATTLTFTGTSGDAINAVTTGQAGVQPWVSGSLRNFTLIGADSASNCSNGVHLGNSIGFVIQAVEVDDFAGTTAGGCSAPAVGIWMDNTVAGGITEGFNVSAVVGNDTVGVLLRKESSGASSFEHGELHLYPQEGTCIGTACSVTQVQQTVLSISGGAELSRGTLYLNGNLAGTSTAIAIDASSGLNEAGVFYMENTDLQGATRFAVTTGGACYFYGSVFSNSGYLTDSGTCLPAGDVSGTGTFQFYATQFGSPKDTPSHVSTAQLTAPALTSCGSSPSILGTDTAGEVTMGTGATGCDIAFNQVYVSAPLCTVTWQGTPLATQSYTVGTTGIVLTQTSASGDKVDYHCIAQSGG